MAEGAKSDLFCFDTKSETWRRVEAEGPPPQRSFHAATAVGNLMFVFGGCGLAGRMNDLWCFDTEVQLHASAPDYMPPAVHGMIPPHDLKGT
jgi:hypothetical protein